MNKKSREMDLADVPLAFDYVVEKLYEALVIHPRRSSTNQTDWLQNPQERKEQILYYLEKSIHMNRLCELTKEFVTTLLEYENFS